MPEVQICIVMHLLYGNITSTGRRRFHESRCMIRTSMEVCWLG